MDWLIFCEPVDNHNRDYILLFAPRVLQKWFNLSDPMLEEMLCDCISFRRFVGLKMEQDVPDETTFVQFRKRLNPSSAGRGINR